ncbi:MAG: zinc-ribbon domain-containing protein [Eubacteriales bacterium]|nr:zinc-ribbon domain-containing protein [Eubacteriales bacterium]
MYCTECGKRNPEGAKFCAFCGKKLFIAEADAPPENAEKSVPSQQPAETAQPAAAAAETPASCEPAEDKPAPQPVRHARAPGGRTIQPLMENPAQPGRTEERPQPAPAPAEQPARPDQPAGEAEQPAAEAAQPLLEEEPYFARREPAAEAVQPLFEEEEPYFARREPAVEAVQPRFEEEEPAQTEEENWWNEPPRQAQPPLPPEDLWAGADEEPDEPEPRERKKIVFPWQKAKEENTVITSSGTEEMPARKPVIARRKRDTHVPERIILPEEQPDEPELEDEYEEEEPRDIFFMRPKKPRRQEDDSIDDAYVNSRVRTILFSIAFAACLFVAVWLFATSSGQMFLAGFNLSSDADAYRGLGDSALANNQVKRAAEAYYRALSLDPQDYDTALLVGKTQQQIGEYDKAADAYYMCTQLQPASVEPYEALIRLYQLQDEPDKAEYFRSIGRANTGVGDLGAQ